MKLACILRVTSQSIITEKGSWNLCFTVSNLLDPEKITNEGYQGMLQNLIRFFKDGRKCWVNLGELFILTLLNKVVGFPVALYHLEKSGGYSDLKARVF